MFLKRKSFQNYIMNFGFFLNELENAYWSIKTPTHQSNPNNPPTHPLLIKFFGNIQSCKPKIKY